MKTIALILSLLLLTSCSNPDTSGGVTLSRGGDHDNQFPYGSFEGPGVKELSGDLTGCGWVHINEESYYIKPHVNLSGADLSDASLHHACLYSADLRGADLRGADLQGVALACAHIRCAALSGANLSYANLIGANLRGLDLSEVKLHHVSKTPQTICPNGIHWTFQGHNCPF